MLSSQEINRMPNAIREFLEIQGMVDNRPLSRVDIIENEKEIIVYVDIPGVRESSLNIDFFNNRVDIKGNRICPYDNNALVTLDEIKYGNLERSIMLPISVTTRESISLKVERGVLSITIDKEREENNRFNLRINSPELVENLE